MKKTDETTDRDPTVQELLDARLGVAKSTLDALQVKLASHEASIAPLRAEVKEAKGEVERVEKAIAAYTGGRLRAPKKKKAAAAPDAGAQA